MASMRPVPSVISVSCSAVAIKKLTALYFAGAAAGAFPPASKFCNPE
jgi:hypothetical protein